MTLKQIAARLEKERQKIVKNRDALRELYDDCAALLDDCDEAKESLTYAIDASVGFNSLTNK